VIKYFDGVFAYVDREFYDELYEMEFPLSELSFYEKQLMGVIERGKRTIIPGLGTIPQGAIDKSDLLAMSLRKSTKTGIHSKSFV